MEKDREDLVSAISKLRASINELDQKGRERLVEAFEKVNKKFNDVYTKLFNGGIAKLEFVESDDPLEAGLELLVSPPGTTHTSRDLRSHCPQSSLIQSGSDCRCFQRKHLLQQLFQLA